MMGQIRFPLLLMGIFALLAGLWAGLLRLGWLLPAGTSHLAGGHGPLMISGFLGTLVSLERAVALNRRWLYVGPLLSGLGAIWLLFAPAGAWLIAGTSLLLVIVSGIMIAQQPALFTVTMGLGAVCWLVGNGFWLAGRPLFQLGGWWGGFLLLTIVGERLELNRVKRLQPLHYRLFGLAVTLFGVGLMVGLGYFPAGTWLTGLGLLALAGWLLWFDIARQNIRRSGLTRFIALNLLAGYGWLAVSGLLTLFLPLATAGPFYDARLHALFLGFVFGMIFAHALIIFPAVTGRAIPFHHWFYAPAGLLQASLLLRLISDLAGWQSGRQWGGLLNEVAILLFLGLVFYSLNRAK